MSEPIHILACNTERGWRGGEHQLLLLARGLRDSDVRCTVLCRADGDLHRRAAADGLPHLAVHCSGGLDPRLIRAIRRAARRDVDLVHAHTPNTHSAGLIATLGLAVPVVVSRKVTFTIGRGWWARRKYGLRVARFIAVSRAVRQVLVDGGVNADRIDVIPDGVDPGGLAPTRDRDAIRTEFGLADDTIAVLCMAAFTAEKGHAVLLEAWRRVAEIVPQAHLLLAGEGGLRASFEADAPPRCSFLGHRNDLPDLVNAVELAVQPSLSEGLGSAAQVALWSGLPCVVSDAGGLPELVDDGKTGLVVPSGDAEALAAGLVRAVGDAQWRAQAGKRARAVARERYHIDRLVAAHRVCYRKTLGA